MLNINQITTKPDIAELLEWFTDEPIFKGVVAAIHGIRSNLNLHERKRAHHRSANYMIENGKLWYIGGGTPTRAITRRECVTQKEAMELAQQEHETGGHFHCDLIKMMLLDRIHSPKLDRSIMTAILDCAKCKNFGSTHLMRCYSQSHNGIHLNFWWEITSPCPWGKGGTTWWDYTWTPAHNMCGETNSKQQELGRQQSNHL